ncbi:hypothetical protein KP79_PYT11871 [Mizuhopecten yessoensis]|uniref:Uncharacterized protein n=1 Tax=Mizuhopecten yessoensis TaxID=6573 RepID=A0A210PYJ2_MIZYE|nr:hypothetical protein KP79_PYT11871 [Mizuhopecten yessoensis]
MTKDAFLDELNVHAKREAPPVNNACVPDIYNKLDADAIEKTRVVNALLDKRLMVQEKVLTKYKHQAEVFYKRQKERVSQELRKVQRKLPSMADFHPSVQTSTRIKKLRMVQSHVHTPVGFTTTPREIKGIPAEKDNRPFCGRFFSHHLPTKAKWYKDIPKPSRSMYRHFGLPPHAMNRRVVLLMSRGFSASDNCLAAGLVPPIIADDKEAMSDNDDAMTI